MLDVARDLLRSTEGVAAIANHVSLRYVSDDQEILGALYLDVRNRLIAESDILRGTLSRAAGRRWHLTSPPRGCMFSPGDF